MAKIELPGDIRVEVFEPPPKRFDALKASAEDLRRHGIPHRPAREQELLFRVWEATFGGKSEHLAPSFSVHPSTKRRLPVFGGTSDQPNSDIWSGSIVTSGSDNDHVEFRYVGATWVVPSVYPPAMDGGMYRSSHWVGIDGAMHAPNLVQAGTAAWVSGIGTTLKQGFYAWWECLPDYEVQIDNFPVAAGDRIQVSVWIHDQPGGVDQTVTFSIRNLTDISPTSWWTATRNANAFVSGLTAEWIVERPIHNGSISTLPEFGSVYFDGGMATGIVAGGPSNAGVALMTEGVPTSMLDAGKLVSVPSFLGASVMRIDYKGP